MIIAMKIIDRTKQWAKKESWKKFTSGRNNVQRKYWQRKVGPDGIHFHEFRTGK